MCANTMGIQLECLSFEFDRLSCNTLLFIYVIYFISIEI